MKKSFMTSVLGGAMLGSLLFFAGPILLMVLLLKFIFTPFGMRRMMFANSNWRMGNVQHQRIAFADKVRSMTNEEYAHFQTFSKEKFQGSCFTRKQS